MDEIDYGAVLADLRARRDKLDAAIAVIEQILPGSPAPAVGPAIPAADGPPPDSAASPVTRVESDSFFGMSASDATRKYLKMVKKPTSLAVIRRALEEGGYLTTAKNFYSNLYTTLMRSPAIFVQVGKDWALAEWYPGRKIDPRTKKGNGGSAILESEEGGEAPTEEIDPSS